MPWPACFAASRCRKGPCELLCVKNEWLLQANHGLAKLTFVHMKKRLFRILRNRYVFTPLLFLVWMAFFHDIDLFFMMKSKRELNEMKAQLEYLEKESEKTREALYDLTTNAETREKYARENYYMKRPNEDVYIVRITE